MADSVLNQGPVKPFKTYEELLQLLKSRGLIINDEASALKTLHWLSYYRISAYSLTLRVDDRFYDNVTFENIVELYDFDKEFRRIIQYYCAVVEVSFRSYISHIHSQNYGPLGYMDSSNFENAAYHQSFISELETYVARSDDIFVEHHRNDLGGVFPIWVASEVMPFGMISKLYKNMLISDRLYIAKTYVGHGREYVENWLQCCSYCRNIAAHGGRFYNRLLFSSPVKLDKRARRDSIKNTSPFAFVIATHHLLPQNSFKTEFIKELESLFSRHPFALKKHMGFPENWKSYL